MRVLVILPTYNEAENVDRIIERLLAYDYLDILVVDDNSTDGTFEKVESWIVKSGRVFFIRRDSKMGLGTAYVNGFKWGLDRGYGLFFEIDADLSHDPSEIPNFIDKCKEGYDLVVGSRYMQNTISVVGWDFKRLLLSKFGNAYASALLGLTQFTDLTSGYRCYTRKALKELNLDLVKSNGYAFQIEMVYRIHKSGTNIAEIPIIFYERGEGSSKMSRKIVREAVLLPFKLIFGK
ncbi:MAG: polyprenol monophosphomannose synthase [Nitrospirae bacterium]|nr:polyprenol monophosphomannose synthase [Nitrospirota bacterium]